MNWCKPSITKLKTWINYRGLNPIIDHAMRSIIGFWVLVSSVVGISNFIKNYILLLFLCISGKFIKEDICYNLWLSKCSPATEGIISSLFLEKSEIKFINGNFCLALIKIDFKFILNVRRLKIKINEWKSLFVSFTVGNDSCHNVNNMD